MVRLLHFSDVHLGAESYGHFDPSTGLSTRLGDFLRALDRIVEYALESEVDLVLFAGDAYKTVDPSPTHQREFARRIAQLGQAGIATVLLVGNHDAPNTRGRASAIDIFAAVQADNTYVADRLEALRIDTRGGPVQIVTLPWISRSLTMFYEESRGRSLTEIYDSIVERLERGVAQVAEGLDPQVPGIFLAHGSVFGAAYSSEQRTILGSEPILPTAMFRHPAFDYVALGHIHKHQVIGENPPIVYSGSIERIDFGEENEEKGFVVAEVRRGGTEWRFVPLPARRFVTIRVTAEEGDPMPAIAQAIADARVADSVVRLIIRTRPDVEPLIDDRELQRLLKDSFHVAAIVREVERTARGRLGSESVIEALKPRELLERYFRARDISGDRLELLLQYVDRLTQESV